MNIKFIISKSMFIHIKWFKNLKLGNFNIETISGDNIYFNKVLNTFLYSHSV